MKSLSLNEVYLALIETAKRLPTDTVDLSDLEEESVNANAGLERDITLLNQAIHKLRVACGARDTQSQAKALVHIRVHAMNLSTIFSDVKDCADSLMLAIGPILDE